MKISIVSIGNKMPAWVDDAYREYSKRLPRELTPQLIELPLAKRGKNTSSTEAKLSEGEQIITTLPKSSRVVALDVLGKAVSTEGLAKKMAKWQMDAVNLSLVIGGPDGLSTKCLQRADERWSLSALTLPHPLVRVVLIEQLYRAWTILQHHPYHK